jgi:hypothetical protein
MTYTQCSGLISPILGTIGTAMMFFGSYTLQPLESGPFENNAVTECNNRIKVKNRRHHWWQRVGIALLCLSFVVQIIAALR